MLSAKNIQNGRIHFDELRLLSDDDFEVENKRTSISAGDVLLTIVGALGRTAVVPEGSDEFTLQRSVAVLKPEIINSNYLRYLLDSPVAQTFFLENAKGTAQKGIYLKALGAMPAPIAPLAEQTRIAAKLDELLAQVDALKTRIDGVPALLKRFRQSVLAAAVSGRLTEEWRLKTDSCEASSEMRLGDESLMVPASWKKTRLGDVTKKDRKLCYGVIQPGPEVDTGVDLIRVCDIKDGIIDWGRLRKIDNGIDAEYSRSRVREGDIVVSIVGTIGRAAIVRESRIANIARAVALISVEQELVLPSWAYIWLTAPVSQWWLTSSSKEVARKTLNLKELIEMPVPRPSIAEQTEIVRRVEQLFAFAEQLEARVKAAQTRIDRLTQSILAKAFRGELVPQDPNDEPASVLLERIKAQRAAAPKAKRGRRAATLG